MTTTPKPSLTLLQDRVLQKFKERAESGLPPPTFKELCAEFGWKSTRAAGAHVEALVRKGYLKSALGSGRRGAFVDIPAVELPLRSDHKETRRAAPASSPILVPKYMLPVGEGGAYVLQVPDVSMVGAGVHQDDLVVVHEGGELRQGDLVVVDEDAALAVRRVDEVGGRQYLRSVPAGSKAGRSSPLRRKAIRGVVVSLMRSYEAARDG